MECKCFAVGFFLIKIKVKIFCEMADLEAVLADVSYLMAMEKSKCTPAARASKKLILPDKRFVFNSLESFFPSSTQLTTLIRPIQRKIFIIFLISIPFKVSET